MPVVAPSTASRTDLRTRPQSADLGYGARGDAVTTLQQQLGARGFGTAVDGRFGPDTLKQLKAFQASAGVPQSGRVDAATRAALNPAPVVETPAPSTQTRAPASDQTVQESRRRAMTNPVGINVANGYVPAPSMEAVRAGTGKLKLGQQGPAVQALQERLNRDGATLDADGKFGPRTEAALKSWQASRSITDTGVVGPTTIAALDANRPATAPAAAQPRAAAAPSLLSAERAAQTVSASRARSLRLAASRSRVR